MSCELIKNNILLYLFSLSNTINYIFYFPFILLYLFEIEDLNSINAIKLYIFFIIYDLIRNTFTNYIQKTVNCFGLNRKISINLFILSIINIFLLCIFYRFENKSYLLNVIIIFRILISLTNISNLFISEIINNIFERKEVYNKLNNFDFYEKINNFLIFILVFFFINTFNKIYFYFFFSSIFNLIFFIIFVIKFKCHDEKPNSEKEDQELNKVKNNNNKTKNYSDKKDIKIKNSLKQKNINENNIFVDKNPLSDSNNKNTIGHKFRRNSFEVKVNGNINDKKIHNMENNNININDIDNNDIILSTNISNQINSKKEISNKDINKKIKEKIDIKKTYQKKNIYILRNTPMASTNRSFASGISKKISSNELKNQKVLNIKKRNFLIFILIPSRFLKYLFLFMLYIKSYHLKNIFRIKIHLIFYCCYFFINILFFHINIKAFARCVKINNGKKMLYLSSIILSIPASIIYIYLFLDNSLYNKNIILEKYILFFILNFILKESLYFLLRIYYINAISIGFSKGIVRKMKKISNISTCFLFLIYNISLLFIKKDSISYQIIKYFLYYFLPLILMILFFIYSINIS